MNIDVDHALSHIITFFGGSILAVTFMTARYNPGRFNGSVEAVMTFTTFLAIFMYAYGVIMSTVIDE